VLLALMLPPLSCCALISPCNMSRVPHSHCKLRVPTAAITDVDRCLNSAGADKSDVTYINAHGTSTAYNDKFETLAIKVGRIKHAHIASVCRHAVGVESASFRR
jgi:Beta-ketoacyl synthase, C-terminal domain